MGQVSASFSVALALAIGSSGVRKFWADAASERLRLRLRLGAAVWRTTGGLELFAAVGLLAGLSFRLVGVAAAVGVTFVMVGAVLLHLRVRLAGRALLPPLVVLGIAALTAAVRVAAP